MARPKHSELNEESEATTEQGADAESGAEICDPDKMLSGAEVAQLFRVTTVQVNRWVELGYITAHPVGPNGERRYDPDELKAFAEARSEGRMGARPSTIAKFEAIAQTMAAPQADGSSAPLAPSFSQFQFKGQSEFQTVIQTQRREISDLHKLTTDLIAQVIEREKASSTRELRLERVLADHEKERVRSWKAMEEIALAQRRLQLDEEDKMRRSKLKDEIAHKLISGIDLVLPGALAKLGLKPTPKAEQHVDAGKSGTEVTSEEEEKELEGAEAFQFFIANVMTVAQYAQVREALGPDNWKVVEKILSAQKPSDDDLRELVKLLASDTEKLGKVAGILSKEQMEALQKIITPFLG